MRKEQKGPIREIPVRSIQSVDGKESGGYAEV